MRPQGPRRHVEPLIGADFSTARRSHIIRYQWDQRVVNHCDYARILWLQGFADQALQIVDGIVDYARSKDHPTSLVYALFQAAVPIALYFLRNWRRVSAVPGTVASQRRYRLAEGFVVMERALARAKRIEEGWCFAELLRKNGDLLLVRATPTDVANAEECFRQALEWGRRQDALSWELRRATSLARLYHRQGRTPQARKVLSPVYRRFTEGFKTPDLLAAKALLESLR